MSPNYTDKKYLWGVIVNKRNDIERQYLVSLLVDNETWKQKGRKIYLSLVQRAN